MARAAVLFLAGCVAAALLAAHKTKRLERKIRAGEYREMIGWNDGRSVPL